MTPHRPRIYLASKLHHAPLWRAFRANHPELEITSRWIDTTEDQELSAGPAEFGHFWTCDIQDIQRSEFLLLYSNSWMETPDVLKGALVEAGAMLGCGGIVLTVGLSTDHSWSYHPRVVRVLNLTEALDFFQRYIIPRRFHAPTTNRGKPPHALAPTSKEPDDATE